MPLCRAVYSVCIEKTIKQNYVVLLCEINYIPSMSFFLSFIESQGKINALGIIFNLESNEPPERNTGRRAGRRKDWKLN